MDLNSSDYFTYKKNKMEVEPLPKPKRISKFNFLLQLFIATFIIMFIIIAIAIMKYSSRVDIEYAQGELSLSNIDTQNISGFDIEDKQGKIDKRLQLIQQEENAPSEAKIIYDKPDNSNVIDAIHLENNNIIEKQVKEEKEKNKPNLVIPDKPDNAIMGAINEIKSHTKKSQEEVPLPENNNITIMSKVLIGKYPTFDEAKKFQEEIKIKNPAMSPFVRKVGEVFSIQTGSYQDFEEAKKQAQNLKAKGFDVWIYQQ